MPILVPGSGLGNIVAMLIPLLSPGIFPERNRELRSYYLGAPETGVLSGTLD